ncbi:universal stress protein [Rubrimonas cliftonensis]|uniref:Universal stress protein family protein n=1 Tax=Rubrimonas cliftonensis TaxID=89524 RepID=A0A1H4CDP8_9RHOB|nr:universal stress protein [Rubrimonas cliftonensis]SEA58527.1 Universal stress protein family protein [Rubrimonas cliftonensis]
MYRTIMTVADGEPRSLRRLQCAAELARRFDAHLSVLAFGELPMPAILAMADDGGAMMAEVFTQNLRDAEARAGRVEAELAREGVPFDVEPLAAMETGVARLVGRLARFADLVVLDQPGPDDAETAQGAALHGALFEAGAPTLVLPPSAGLTQGRSALIAWDDSREALKAVRGAMPFLRAASAIEIVVVDPDGDQATSSEGLALMLSRHGLSVGVSTIAPAGRSTSDLLRQRIRDTSSDLLVMGAYGHSRLREAILGGVTAEILADAPAPVLMGR